MKMKTFKERVLRQKEQPNIYMQKTQGPKTSFSSPDLDLRFKSKTLLNKQNQQPNLPNRVQKPTIQNTFGAAKMMMRKSVDQFRLHLNSGNQQKVLTKELLHSLKNSQPNLNILSKSNNFERCSTQRSLNNKNAFSKKHMKTEECEIDDNDCPIIEDCEFIRSEYESSQDSCHEEKLNYAKSYQRPKMSNAKNILIHESLNYEEERPRQLVTFGPSAAKNLKRYQVSREEQKKMKKQIVNNILMSTKAEIMRSCDFDTIGSLVCVNHTNKKAKYRLNADLTEEQEECFYCSKCAVNLAKQGFDIQEISPLDRKMIMSRQPQRQFFNNSVELRSLKSQRQQQFVNFEKRLQNLKTKISAKLNLFNQKSEQMTKIDKKIQLTISNYDNLIDILKEMRQQEMNKVENFKKQKTLDINLKKHELATILDNIKDTFSEINSERNKLMSLKNKEFSFMFDSYIKKISSYEEYLTNLEQTQLAQDIAAFDAKLESQELDEEAMIHKIFDDMYKKLMRPKLKALDPKSIQTISLRKSQNHKRTNEIQSGGSSMFYCEEELQESRPPFRILFQNCNAQEPNMNAQSDLNETMNVNSSIENSGYRSVRYFKEEQYLPTFHHHQ